MNVVMLSGGSGQRLWPLSNGVRSKQFIRVFEDGNRLDESMLERSYRQIKRVDPEGAIVIATSSEQVPLISGQIGDEVDLSIEPCRKDTFPAIALAVSYLHDKKGIDVSDPVVVMPVDAYAERGFFEAIVEISENVRRTDANLTLLGIEPTEPSDQFGYIIPEMNGGISRVALFKEKPDCETAKSYIADGALWNCGVFAFRAGYVLDIARDLLGASSYDDLRDSYDRLQRISFDYAVVEKEPMVDVARYKGIWSDLGSWGALAKTIDEPIRGNVIVDSSCKDVFAFNYLDAPMIVSGLSDSIVVATLDGILVSSLKQADQIKAHVGTLANDAKYIEWPWGIVRVVSTEPKGCGTLLITIRQGRQMQSRNDSPMDKGLLISRGRGILETDGGKVELVPGNSIVVKPGQEFTIIAESDMVVVETTVLYD